MTEPDAAAGSAPPTGAAGLRQGRFRQVQFRQALSRFATGVTIVTATGPDGLPVGATMSSFNAVSLEPPLVLFSVGHGLRSLAAFRQAPGYAIHVLHSDQAELARRFGRPAAGPDAAEKWDGLSWRPGHGAAPVLNGALAHFECRPHARHRAGDHDVFIVEVVRQTLHDEDGEPLLFYGGRLFGLGAATAPPAR